MTDERQPWVDGCTIGQVLRRTAGRFGERDAVVFPQAELRYSFAEFDSLVDDVARGLLALDFKMGDRLGVWSSNWPEWVLLQFATARIGVILVTVNPSYVSTELDYVMKQAELRGLALTDHFRSTDYFFILDEICPQRTECSLGDLQSDQFPFLKWLISIRSRGEGMLRWDDLIAAGSTVPRDVLADRERAVRPSDAINLQYTSGTTGHPKGATLSHRNLLLNAYYGGAYQKITHEDRICIPVPLYHCFGCVLGSLCSVVHGAAMVFPHEYFDASKTLDAIEQERCTAIYGVPTMFIAQLEHESYQRRDLSSLRTGIMAGSPCPIELMKRVTTQMGAREITIGYGLTETSPLVTQTRTDDPIELRVGTVGRPLPDIEVKIVDVETGKTLADGQTGELFTRGHIVMLGYYNNPEQTAKTIDKDGWLHTGDLALRESNGYYRITGRLKDTIIRGGENISPREIEEMLYAHPQVEEVQVVGVPSRKYGEEVLAWIKLRRGALVTETEITEFCRERLAHFKTPKYVKFVSSFPTTVTGKIQKYKIREQAIQDLGLADASGVETA